MNDVQPENKRNVQARFFDSNVLVSVCLLCSGDVEQRTDLSLCDHVFVIGASRAWTSLLARRVLHQLSDLFFEGHLAEKGLHSGIQAGSAMPPACICVAGACALRQSQRSSSIETNRK